ncbi:MAG: class I SAM-dependent methyltransferase [Chitinophagaceae bacterium]|nr:class I SAM-dependent methyltransferase [Chitinophagaceae bacterium]MCW5905300.1 class I SAM-dependent methyltransferase [Chitinophagaceae bacterium]
MLKSPITGSENISKEIELDIQKIKELYADLNVDVSVFFKNYTSISIYQCNDSGYRFYYPFDIMGDDHFYEQLSFENEDYYPEKKWEFIKAISAIRKDDTLLEVGCGNGYFLDLCKKKNIAATGLEINQKSIANCTKKGLNVLSEYVQEHAIKNAEKYDIVCSFQVLEHIVDVDDFIKACMQCLKPGGKLIYAIPNSNPYLFRYDIYHTLNLPPHHAGLWNKKALHNLKKYYPLNVCSIETEPVIVHYKKWWDVHLNHLREKRNFWYRILKLIPRIVYKRLVQISNAEGAYILAIYEKKK